MRREINAWVMDPSSDTTYDVTRPAEVFWQKVSSISIAQVPVGSDGLTRVTSVNANRQGYVLQNIGSADVYLAPLSGVQQATGFRLQPGEKFSEDGYNFTGGLFGATVTGTVTLQKMEFFR